MCAMSDTEKLLADLTNPQPVVLPRQADGERDRNDAKPLR